MQLINKPIEWFKGDEAQNTFNGYQSLAGKSIHIYSYLKLITNTGEAERTTPTGYEKENALFKIAFYLADEVSHSSLPYASYKKLIDPNENPYVAYITKFKEFIDSEKLFIAFCAILHNKVDAFDDTSWIYNMDFWSDKELTIKLAELDCGYISLDENSVNSPSAFTIEKDLEMLQLELFWLFRCDTVDYSKITESVK